MICTVWGMAGEGGEGGPSGRDVFYRAERDLDSLIEAERREVILFRLSWRWRSQARRCDREVYRQRIAVLRALRFAIEVLS